MADGPGHCPNEPLVTFRRAEVYGRHAENSPSGGGGLLTFFGDRTVAPYVKYEVALCGEGPLWVVDSSVPQKRRQPGFSHAAGSTCSPGGPRRFQGCR